MIALPRSKWLTQGTIFSAALAEDYGGHDVFGLAITARCDVANDKTPTYSYLPIVNITDWLRKDGTQIAQNRASSDARSRLSSMMTRMELSPSPLEYVSRSEILDKIITVRAKERKDWKIIPKSFSDISKELSELEKDVIQFEYMWEKYPKVYESIIKDLCDHKIAEYYPLPNIDPNNNDDGYVILLREMRHLPRKIVRAIELGIDDEQYKILCQDDPSLSDLLLIGPGVAWPISYLLPPYIEHLMQRWTLLFSRIGVDGFGPGLATSFRNRLQNTINPS